MAKQNKFTKSVLERLEQEAVREKQTGRREPKAGESAPASDAVAVAEQAPQISPEVGEAGKVPPPPEAAAAAPALPEVPPPAEVGGAAPAKPEAAQVAKVTTAESGRPSRKAKGGAPAAEPGAMPDLSQYLRRAPERIAKNKTFYLDKDLVDTIKSVSKAQNVTESRLVNDILRQVLGLG